MWKKRPLRLCLRTGLALVATVLFLTAAVAATRASAQKKKKVSTLSGVIYRGDREHPVAGAQVVLTAVKSGRHEDENLRAETRSDAAGAYRLDNLEAANYRVTIRTAYAAAEEVPCKLHPARTADEHSLVTMLEEDGKFIEQVFISHFPVKAGKQLAKDFDLTCQSVFAK